MAASRSPSNASSLASPTSAAGRSGTDREGRLERRPGAGRVAGRDERLAQRDVVEAERVALEPLVDRGGDRGAVAGDRGGRVALDEGQPRGADLGGGAVGDDRQLRVGGGRGREVAELERRVAEDAQRGRVGGRAEQDPAGELAGLAGTGGATTRMLARIAWAGQVAGLRDERRIGGLLGRR